MSKVCILLSTYNGEKYLRELLDSVLAQNTNNGEIKINLFVRDDGSKDKTVEILKEYAEKGLLTLAQYGEPNVGYARSFSWLLKNAPESDYYAFCDQDDVWLPNKIFNAVEKLNAEDNNMPLLYTTSLIVVNENLKEITRNTHAHMSKNSPTQFEENILQNNVYGCTIVINSNLRKLYLTVPVEQIVSHDYILAILASSLGRLVFDDNPQILYRQHGNNTIGFYKGSLKNIIRTLRFVIKNDMKNNKWKNVKTLRELFFENFNKEQQRFIDNLYNYRQDKNKKKELIKFIKTNIKNKFVKNYNLALIRLNKF